MGTKVLIFFWEQSILVIDVRIIKRKTLMEFWKKYPEAEQALKAWYHEAKKAE